MAAQLSLTEYLTVTNSICWFGDHKIGLSTVTGPITGDGIRDLIPRKTINGGVAHESHGRAAAFSHDGRFLATAADDIVLWDAIAMTVLARFVHSSIVWHVAFSPDGRSLVSAHGDGSILIWDVAKRKQVANLNEHADPVRGVAFSPDGKLIASAGEDRSVMVWNAHTGQREAVLLGHPSRVTTVAFAPDGRSVASADFTENVILWYVVRREPRLTLKAEGKAIYSLAISPDGRYLAHTLKAYESTNGRQVADFESMGLSQFYGVAFSPDGNWLASASPQAARPSLHLLDTQHWRLRDQIVVNDAHFISVSFSPDNRHLVTGDDEGTVRLWETNPLRQVALLGSHSSRIKCVAFSPDGKQVASSGDDKAIRLWEVNRRRLVSTIGTHTAPVLSVAFSPDGKRLVSVEHDKSVRLYTRHRTLWGHRLD